MWYVVLINTNPVCLNCVNMDKAEVLSVIFQFAQISNIVSLCTCSKSDTVHKISCFVAYFWNFLWCQIHIIKGVLFWHVTSVKSLEETFVPTRATYIICTLLWHKQPLFFCFMEYLTPHDKIYVFLCKSEIESIEDSFADSNKVFEFATLLRSSNVTHQT